MFVQFLAVELVARGEGPAGALGGHFLTEGEVEEVLVGLAVNVGQQGGRAQVVGMVEVNLRRRALGIGFGLGAGGVFGPHQVYAGLTGKIQGILTLLLGQRPRSGCKEAVRRVGAYLSGEACGGENRNRIFPSHFHKRAVDGVKLGKFLYPAGGGGSYFFI